MNFRHLTDCLGGTVFADDYRTNLKTASEQIAALEARASANPKGNDKTQLLLVKAVYSSICGDFVSADGYLGQLSSIAQSTNDSSLLARCNVYNTYMQCTRNDPPFLRFRVNIDTGPAIARGIGISASRARLSRQRTERGTLELSSLEKFEANVLIECTRFLDGLRLEALPEHPQYPKDIPIVLFQGERDYWDNIGQPGEDTNFPVIASYFNQLTLQYRLAGNASNARSSLLSIYEDVLERGNLIAAACCQLQLGDAILSPPFTSPLALNLVSVVSELGWDNDMWDKRQHEFPLKQDAEAIQSYQQAHFLFEAGGSGRGMAAVLLRYSCLDLAEYMMEPTRNDANTEKSLVRSAYNHLTAAKGLFEGDITNTLVVDSHLAICKIFLGEFYTALEICFDIGEMGKRTGNSCTCEFVGLLHLRLARRLLAFGKARVQHARVLCACATVCFKGLENPYLELHAVAASTILHQRRGDIPTATKHLQYGRKLLELTAIYFDNLQAQVESLRIFHDEPEQSLLNHDSQMLQAKHTSCVWNFDRLASSVRTFRSNTQNTSLSSSNQLSSMVSILQSFSLGGIDPSSIAALQSLMPGVKSIDAMRQKYEDAIKSRRDELVNNADIDAAEKHLTDFVQELDKLHIFSEELDTMKTAALQYLGDYNRAMETITRVLPTSFGGTRDPFPILEGPSKQIKDVTDKAERQKFDRAVSLCFAAKDWKRGMAGVQAMLQRDVTSLDDMKKSEDPHIWYNMVCIASVLEHNMELGLAFEWYLGAFDVIEAYRQQLADIEDRRDILSSISSGEIFLGLARIAFHFSQTHNSPCGPSGQWILTSAEWKDQILRFLELGRSRTLLDLLTAQELASKENFEKDFEKWADYSYELRRQESPSRGELTAETNSQDCTGSESEGREKYLERIHDELVKELNPKNLSTFLSNPVAVRESNAKLYQSIPETAIVLHISSGREGLMILCITSQGIIDIHTSELTGLQLDRHIFRFAKLFRHKGLEDRNLPTIATCNQHIQAISDALIEPVAQHIKMKEHVIFIPSPSLNKFPLCALVYNKEPLFLSKDVSQVPSLSILQYLVDKKRHNNKKVSVIYNNPNAAEGPLFVSTSAAIYIARSFHTMPQAAAEELTLENFANIYEQSDVLLLATHGTLGLTSAWESYLSLKEPFLVRNLVRLHSEASLIIFEACVSGLGEESIGNDLLGFSHAVIGSGVNSFLGGLWYLRDHATALLMLFLFEEFETDKGSKTLARCWRNAQKKLYKLDVAGALEIFEDMRERCVEACDAKLIDEKLKISLRRALRYVIRDLPRMGVNYNHPFYWAGFVLTGHAGLMLEL